MSEESNLSDVTSQESNISNYDTDDTVRTSSTRPIDTTRKPAAGVSTDDESILKFTLGEPIIDQRNPFKKNNNKNYDKKSNSPTKIPQLKREQYKNAVNALKKSPSDDLITTEEVLRQSKYVKTYIKNPDPYFVYDPAILERIREEELKRKEEIKEANKENIKALKKKLVAERQTKELKTPPKSKIPYKKCSKPNYPDLADIKVKVGTDTDGTYLNPTEVKTNVKKFDECVKQKHFNFDEDFEDMEEHLPKSNSNEDITTKNNHNQNETHTQNQTNGNNDGSFTNTINSKDFQQYLVKKGLVLAPQQLVNEAKTTRIYTAPPKPNRTSNILKSPEPRHISYNQRPQSAQPDTDSEGTPKKVKKSSLLQRLLANNIFSARRKTTPKEPVPKPRSLYDAGGNNVQLNGNQRQLPLTKRIVLERKSDPSESRSAAFNYISNPMPERDVVDHPTLRRQPKNGNTQELQGSSNREPYAKNHMMNERNSAPSREAAKTLSSTNLPQQSSKIQQRPLFGTQQAPAFARTASMDRNEIIRRSKAVAPLRTLQIFNPNHSLSSDMTFEPHGPKTTSTPIRPRSSTESQPQRFASSSTIASSLYDDPAHSNPNISKSDWLRLREQQQLQQSTDRELYTNVLNRKPQNNENLYERLPIRHIQHDQQAAMQPIYSSLDQRCYFVRGGQQRNTFCGSSRDPNYKNYNNIVPATEQAQSENNFQLSHVNMLERNQPSRLSTSTLSREEIIEKVKQFCRNSMRRKTEKQMEQKSESTAEVPLAGTEVSPETPATAGSQQLRPAGRKPAPQVPQRMQSLKRNPEPAMRGGTIPLYANLWKDNRMSLRPQAEAPYLGAENIPYATVERRGRAGLAVAPQHISNTILESAEQGATRSSFENGRNLMRHLAKPPRPSQQTVMHGQNYGRNTPLILERSQNLQSQIYRPRLTRAAMTQPINLDDRLLVQTNSCSGGQHFSGSLDFQPIAYLEQMDGERIARQQQQPMLLAQYEPYLLEVGKNVRRNNNEGPLHSSKTA